MSRTFYCGFNYFPTILSRKIIISNKNVFSTFPCISSPMANFNLKLSSFQEKINLSKSFSKAVVNGNFTYQLNKFFSSQTPSNEELERIKKLARGSRNKSGPKEYILTWKNVLITLGIGGVCVLFMLYLKREKELKKEKERMKSLGKASLGGPWELVDHTGKLCKSSDFRGKWILIYFGFTHCPDVCPDEIEKIVKVVDIIEKDPQVKEVVPLFITVDPHRDDIKAVSNYIKEFSPKIIGFSGSVEQIKKATRAYRVYYSEGPKDGDDDYIVDHTIISYLVNPNEEFTDFYGQNKSVEDMVDSIKMHMVKFNSINKKS